MTTIITERLQKYSIQSAEAEKDALKVQKAGLIVGCEK